MIFVFSHLTLVSCTISTYDATFLCLIQLFNISSFFYSFSTSTTESGTNLNSNFSSEATIHPATDMGQGKVHLSYVIQEQFLTNSKITMYFIILDKVKAR